MWYLSGVVFTSVILFFAIIVLGSYRVRVVVAVFVIVVIVVTVVVFVFVLAFIFIGWLSCSVPLLPLRRVQDPHLRRVLNAWRCEFNDWDDFGQSLIASLPQTTFVCSQHVCSKNTVRHISCCYPIQVWVFHHVSWSQQRVVLFQGEAVSFQYCQGIFGNRVLYFYFHLWTCLWYYIILFGLFQVVGICDVSSEIVDYGVEVLPI